MLEEEFSKPIQYEKKILTENEGATYETITITDFVGLTIKDAYDKNPKIKYPMITIQEIDNSEARQYTSNIGEEFSNIAYQINAYTRDISSMQSPEAIRLMGNKINNVLGVQLRMVRSGNVPPVPLPSDNTILQYSLRYTGVLDIIRNIIYKD